MEEVPPLVYNQNYRKASCCNKIFYGYILNLFEKIKANDNKMTVDMVEDMTAFDGETDAIVKFF